MYSSAWKNRNSAPSPMVAASQNSRPRRLAARSAWCASVIVTPELSSSIVFSSGRPQAGIVSKLPPIAAGPFAGQPAE